MARELTRDERLTKRDALVLKEYDRLSKLRYKDSNSKLYSHETIMEILIEFARYSLSESTLEQIISGNYNHRQKRLTQNN